MLDVRIPIALMFLIYGVLLAGYGLAEPVLTPLTQDGAAGIGPMINLNLNWGIVMSVFGFLMWLLVKLDARDSGK
jgi:hypothetical protein